MSDILFAGTRKFTFRVCRKRPRRHPSEGEGRRGAAAVEFAVIAPILFLLIIGMIEFGRAVMIQQLLTNAARRGARQGILEQATVSEVETAARDYLSNTTVSGASVSVSPSTFEHVGFGDPVTVTCSVSYDQVSLLPVPWFLGGKNLTAESAMLAERPE